MASKRNISSILLLLVILSIIPFSTSSPSKISPYDEVTKPLLDQLCSQPGISKHFCIAWLSSDPKTFTHDIQTLVNMMFEKTISLGNKNIEMFEQLINTTTDMKIKPRYVGCEKLYISFMKGMRLAQIFALSNNYMSAYDAAFKYLEYINMCESLLGQPKTPAYVIKSNWMFKLMRGATKGFVYVLCEGN